MGENSKPILSVLVDEDKKEKFAELARRHKYSMGWILNDCIDRMLEVNSVEICRTSAGITEERPNLLADRIDRETIQRMIDVSINGMRMYVDESIDTSPSIESADNVDKVPNSNQQPEPSTKKVLSSSADKDDRSNPWDLCDRATRAELHKCVKGRSATDLQPAPDKAATMGRLGWRYNKQYNLSI